MPYQACACIREVSVRRWGFKRPSTELNEEDKQQDGEGTEDYRLLLTVSTLF